MGDLVSCFLFCQHPSQFRSGSSQKLLSGWSSSEPMKASTRLAGVLRDQRAVAQELRLACGVGKRSLILKDSRYLRMGRIS